jgi:hypothetical protein
MNRATCARHSLRNSRRVVLIRFSYDQQVN